MLSMDILALFLTYISILFGVFDLKLINLRIGKQRARDIPKIQLWFTESCFLEKPSYY